MKAAVINTSPRSSWNTAKLVKEAARGAESAGAEISYYDLYRQEKFTGCISCFACKRFPNEGYCAYKDGLYPILQAIKEADAVIIGTPNYLGLPSAGFHALYERLIFQNITYQTERPTWYSGTAPTLFIMTSNAPEEAYQPGNFYENVLTPYIQGLERTVGPTSVLISGNTLQVSDYSRYNWTMLDAQAKIDRHETVFPKELEKAFRMGADLISDIKQTPEGR